METALSKLRTENHELLQ